MFDRTLKHFCISKDNVNLQNLLTAILQNNNKGVENYIVL